MRSLKPTTSTSFRKLKDSEKESSERIKTADRSTCVERNLISSEGIHAGCCTEPSLIETLPLSWIVVLLGVVGSSVLLVKLINVGFFDPEIIDESISLRASIRSDASEAWIDSSS